jgi:hypothetical protein
MSDFIMLSSGKKVISEAGFVGIGEEDEQQVGAFAVIASGRDSETFVFSSREDVEEHFGENCLDESEIEHHVWTPAERKELAELMIERWKRFGGIE